MIENLIGGLFIVGIRGDVAVSRQRELANLATIWRKRRLNVENNICIFGNYQ